jgi:hypothetical protein
MGRPTCFTIARTLRAAFRATVIVDGQPQVLAGLHGWLRQPHEAVDRAGGDLAQQAAFEARTRLMIAGDTSPEPYHFSGIALLSRPR